MPKTRARNKRAPKSYTQYYTSSEDENDLGIVSGFLEFLMQPKAKTTKRTPNKKRCSTNCPCYNKTAPKQKSKHTKDSGNNKGRKKKDEAPTTLNSHINLDSDDEMASTSTTTAYTNSIKNKVDNFFKDIESDDEELESNIKADSLPIKVPIDKNDDFYTILSDSENEEDKKIKEKISSIINAPASTGGLLDAVPTGLNFVNDFKVNPEKKAEDLLAYVDNILKESDETMDLTDSKPKENVPELTLEDMKKKTDEILGDAASLIDNFKPKPKVPEKKTVESPAKEAPTCPICLEQLGGSRQAMATLCGHMFCEPCLKQVIKTTKKCPSCRKGLTKTKYHPVYL